MHVIVGNIWISYQMTAMRVLIRDFLNYTLYNYMSYLPNPIKTSLIQSYQHDNMYSMTDLLPP